MEETPENVADLLAERRHLLNLGFRMLGSRAEAEDVVQETYARWYQLSDEERRQIRNTRGWLTTVASRICLNVLDSARHRRERYVGEWLPEPLSSTTSGTESEDPLDRVTLDDSVSMALLVVLESLTPAERVSFVLHDVFALPFDDVAQIVGRTPQAARKLASSARRHIEDRRTGEAPAPVHRRLVEAFRAAAEGGDINAMIGILDPEVTAISDGGGRIRAALRPIHGPDKVARFLLGAFSRRPGLGISERSVNGQAGLVLTHDEAVIGVVSVHVIDARIHDVWLVLNPEKLGTWHSGTRG